MMQLHAKCNLSSLAIHWEVQSMQDTINWDVQSMQDTINWTMQYMQNTKYLIDASEQNTDRVKMHSSEWCTQVYAFRRFLISTI